MLHTGHTPPRHSTAEHKSGCRTIVNKSVPEIPPGGMACSEAPLSGSPSTIQCWNNACAEHASTNRQHRAQPSADSTDSADHSHNTRISWKYSGYLVRCSFCATPRRGQPCRGLSWAHRTQHLCCSACWVWTRYLLSGWGAIHFLHHNLLAPVAPL